MASTSRNAGACIAGDAGQELPRNGECYGHLEARGPTVTAAYLKQPASLSADRWLQAGDVAKLFPDGMVEIVDRSNDVIKSGDEWFVETLPMTATGKIHKVTLRERLKEPRHVSHG